MDEIDQAFYELVVAQRNKAWYDNDKLKAENATLREELDKRLDNSPNMK